MVVHYYKLTSKAQRQTILLLAPFPLLTLSLEVLTEVSKPVRGSVTSWGFGKVRCCVAVGAVLGYL